MTGLNKLRFSRDMTLKVKVMVGWFLFFFLGAVEKKG